MQKELVTFLKDVYNIKDAESIVALNLAMTKDKDTQYPIQFETKSNIAHDMLGINSDIVTIDHNDKSTVDDSWYFKAYHWNRKLSYWKCNAS